MIDIKLVREEPEMVRKNLKKRNDDSKLKLLEELITADKQHRALIQEDEELRARRNKVSQEIADLLKAKKDAAAAKKEAAKIPERLKEVSEERANAEIIVRNLLMRIPNLLDEGVPAGKGEADNKVIKTFGKPPKFAFTPRNHLEILEGLGMIDGERAAKVAGHGFFYLKGDAVLLGHAITAYALNFLRKKGYMMMEPPFMMQRKPYEGATDVSDFENVMYKAEGEDLYLIATSEHPMAAMLMDETVLKEKLPIKLCGVSPCFRKEVGAHGKYTRGLFRTHHFNKVEQFVFCLPEQSAKFHEELQKNVDEMYKELGVHFRTVNVCTGDIGTVAAKKYDTEFWMADGVFREIGSNSNCTDYQARRLNIKFREKEGAAPGGYLHTLNSTALVTSRTMIAIIEQFQQKDGTVKIPTPLIPFMHGIKVLGKGKV